MRTNNDMIRLNGYEYEYRPGMSLAGLVEEYNQANATVDFHGCVVVINGAAVPEAQAREWQLSDNETVYIVPKLDGG